MRKIRDIETIAGKLVPLLRSRKEVIAAYLFGSTVTGETHAGSDIDIALLVDKGMYRELDRAAPYGYKARMISDLAHVLGTDKVDLVILNEAPPLLANEVISKGKLLFCRNDRARLRFEAWAKLRYADTAPLREIKRSYLYKRISEGRFSEVKSSL